MVAIRSEVKLLILSWNVQRINNHIKNMGCLDAIGRQGAHIALLQETRIIDHDINKIVNCMYKVAASSSAVNKTKGVIMLIYTNLNIQNIDKGNDEEGRIIYIKISFLGKRLALISVYAPNVYEPALFDNLSKILDDLRDYQLILGGDMNAKFNPLMDRSKFSSSGSSSTSVLINVANNFSIWISGESITLISDNLPFFQLDIKYAPELIIS